MSETKERGVDLWVDGAVRITAFYFEGETRMWVDDRRSNSVVAFKLSTDEAREFVKGFQQIIEDVEAVA